MATSYSDIYCLNRLIKNDPRLKKLSPSELDYLCYGYLKFAISYFLYDCRKDLTARTEPYNMDFKFIANGTDTEFILEPNPPEDVTIEASIIGEEEDTVIPEQDYTYNSKTFTVTFNTPPDNGQEICINGYSSGEFEEDLDDREKNILAEGMNVPYLEEARNDENALKYIISGNSLRFFSQANHMLATTESVTAQMYQTVDGLISDYSYKGSLDDYKGLGGRGSGA